MIGQKVRSHLEHVGEPVFRRIHRWGISPNTLTLIGLLMNILAGLLLLKGLFPLGGLVILAAGICDILDGGVARIGGRGNHFGAFLDSVIDRYSDFFILMGILLYYAGRNQVGLVALSCLTILGTALIPYARARAECFLPQCNVGWMERPERIILLSAGALTHLMPVALALLTLLTQVTVFQRIKFCWKHLSQAPESIPDEGGYP